MQASSFCRVGVVAVLVTAAGAAMAADYGNVIAATPVTAQVAVPQQVCRDEQQWAQPRSSGGGALIGALIGGAIGNAFGSGGGRALATGVGVMTGAVVGNQAEMGNQPRGMTTVRNCQTVSAYDNQVVGYDVVYEYNGQRYSTRTAQDPGRYIPLDVSVAPSAGWQAVPARSAAPRQPPYSDAPVYYPAPAYGGYVTPATVVVPSVSIGVGVGGGGHWRQWR